MPAIKRAPHLKEIKISCQITRLRSTPLPLIIQCYGGQLNRILAKVDPDNMSGILVLKRSSWQFEGALRQDVRVHGMFRDGKLYSLLKKEFATSSMA